jgi:hypothetical protein
MMLEQDIAFRHSIIRITDRATARMTDDELHEALNRAIDWWRREPTSPDRALMLSLLAAHHANRLADI